MIDLIPTFAIIAFCFLVVYLGITEYFEYQSKKNADAFLKRLAILEEIHQEEIER